MEVCNLYHMLVSLFEIALDCFVLEPKTGHQNITKEPYQIYMNRVLKEISIYLPTISTSDLPLIFCLNLHRFLHKVENLETLMIPLLDIGWSSCSS
jgi:hypothetical protein